MSITKQIQLFALSTLLVVNVFALSIISLDFEINQDYYIEIFCENKDKPELHCDGQCHLKKTLDKVETQNTENSIPSFQLEFTQTTSFNIAKVECDLTLNHNPFYSNLYYNLISSLFFHPPSC